MKILVILFFLILGLNSQEVESKVIEKFVQKWFDEYTDQEFALLLSTVDPLYGVVNERSKPLELALSTKRYTISEIAVPLKKKWDKSKYYQKLRIELLLAHLMLSDAKKNHQFHFLELKKLGVTMRNLYFNIPEKKSLEGTGLNVPEVNKKTKAPEIK